MKRYLNFSMNALIHEWIAYLAFRFKMMYGRKVIATYEFDCDWSIDDWRKFGEAQDKIRRCGVKSYTI